jgi:hypothetical protein
MCSLWKEGCLENPLSCGTVLRKDILLKFSRVYRRVNLNKHVFRNEDISDIVHAQSYRLILFAHLTFDSSLFYRPAK